MSETKYTIDGLIAALRWFVESLECDHRGAIHGDCSDCMNTGSAATSIDEDHAYMQACDALGALESLREVTS